MLSLRYVLSISKSKCSSQSKTASRLICNTDQNKFSSQSNPSTSLCIPQQTLNIQSCPYKYLQHRSKKGPKNCTTCTCKTTRKRKNPETRTNSQKTHKRPIHARHITTVKQQAAAVTYTQGRQRYGQQRCTSLKPHQNRATIRKVVSPFSLFPNL